MPGGGSGVGDGGPMHAGDDNIITIGDIWGEIVIPDGVGIVMGEYYGMSTEVIIQMAATVGKLGPSIGDHNAGSSGSLRQF